MTTKTVCNETLNKSLEMIAADGCRFHHKASRKGYCPAGRVGTAEPYNGRFGRGWVVLLGRLYGVSNSFTAIAYYVK